MNRSRPLIIALLILGLLQLFAGCMTTISPGDYNRHYQEQAELVMVDSSKYTLARNWTVDSNYCIRGRGMYMKNDSTKIFNVNIPISGVSRLSVQDDITPIYFELLIASAIFIHFL